MHTSSLPLQLMPLHAAYTRTHVDFKEKSHFGEVHRVHINSCRRLCRGASRATGRIQYVQFDFTSWCNRTRYVHTIIYYYLLKVLRTRFFFLFLRVITLFFLSPRLTIVVMLVSYIFSRAGFSSPWFAHAVHTTVSVARQLDRA